MTTYYDNFKQLNFTIGGFIDFPGNHQESRAFATNSISWQDTKLGSDNPSWKSQVANHVTATTEYFRNSLWIDHISPPRIEVRFRSTSFDEGNQSYSGKFLPAGFYNIEPYNFDDLDNQAITYFIKNVRKTMTAFQGGTFLGELREAVHMIRHPADALRKGIGNYLGSLKKLKANSRFRRSKPANRRKAVAGTWLEYMYGWRPLISDIDSACDALTRDRSLSQATAHVSSKAKSEKFYPPWLVQQLMGYTVLNSSQTAGLKSAVRYKGAVFTECDSPATFQLRNYGFDPSSWMPTLWELIPYSFLVDYFSNIGGIIDAYTLPNSRLAWGVRTLRNELTISGTQTWDWFYPPGGDAVWHLVEVNRAPGTYQLTMRRFLRQPISGFPVPSLRFRLPGFRDDWGKWANMSALLLQSRKLAPM